MKRSPIMMAVVQEVPRMAKDRELKFIVRTGWPLSRKERNSEISSIRSHTGHVVRSGSRKRQRFTPKFDDGALANEADPVQSIRDVFGGSVEAMRLTVSQHLAYTQCWPKRQHFIDIRTTGLHSKARDHQRR
jgi:hypothetical protein